MQKLKRAISSGFHTEGYSPADLLFPPGSLYPVTQSTRRFYSSVRSEPL